MLLQQEAEIVLQVGFVHVSLVSQVRLALCVDVCVCVGCQAG